MAMLGRPHTLSILHAFQEPGSHPIRFTELQTRLGVSPKTLSVRLRTLVEAGFLVRRAYHEIPPRVEYEATPKTVELVEVFRNLDRWAERHSLRAVPVVSVVGRAPSGSRRP